MLLYMHKCAIGNCICSPKSCIYLILVFHLYLLMCCSDIYLVFVPCSGGYIQVLKYFLQNYEFRKYMEDIPNDLAPLNMVAVNLVICGVICKFKIEPPRDEKQFWNKLQSKLVLNDMDPADYKELYNKVESAQDFKRFAL